MKHRTLYIALIALLLIGCVSVAPRGTSAPAPTASPTQAVAQAPTATALSPTSTAAATQAPTPTQASPTPTTAAQGASVLAPDWTDLSPYRQAMRSAYTGDVDQFTDATHYAIDLQVDLDAATFEGTIRVRYTNAEDTSLDQIVFRLLPNTPGYGTPEGAPAALDVSSLTLDGTPVQAERRLYNSALYLPLSTPLAPGDAVEIDMAFTGTLPADPAAGYAQYGYIDGVLAIPDFYPLIPVYDDEGWNVELAPTYGDATFTDTALYLVRVTLPGDVTLAASGVAIDQQQNDDGTVSTTFASGPMRDFMVAASRDYQTAQTQVDDVLVTSYYLGSTAGGERALDYASSSLRIYEDLIGAYPFNELDVVATPTRAGGIEYPGLIVVAANLYEQSGGFFEMATVHEVGHQWWYSLVGNDQLDEPWLDESFTQYTAMLYYERRYGAGAAANVLENYFRAPYEHLPPQEQQIPIGLPVADYTADLYGVIVYDKGPLFFDQIRTQVGKEAFGRFMQSYLTKYRYGIVYPQDLVDSVESTSGQQIDALYQQWVVGS